MLIIKKNKFKTEGQIQRLIIPEKHLGWDITFTNLLPYLHINSIFIFLLILTNIQLTGIDNLHAENGYDRDWYGGITG